MQKVLIIGSGGSGKSTLARELAKTLNIELLHLDLLYWKPGWVEPPKKEWEEFIKELIKKDAWVMDGNYSGTLAKRLEACDTVIFLDRSPLLCLWRVLKRRTQNQNTNRQDMAKGCNERLSLEFMLWVWNYPKRTKPKVIKLLKENSKNKQIFHLRSEAEIKSFLANCKNLA